MSNQVQELLHLPHVRPRFEAVTSLEQATIEQLVRTALAQPTAPCQGQVIEGYVNLWLPQEDQHYWSPELSLSLETLEDQPGTLLRGLYGPRPSVWTMFVFFYAFLAFVAGVIFIIGTSRWSLGMPSTILWWLPVVLMLLASIYATSYLGQRFGHEQTHILHQFLADSTGLTIREAEM